jgi:chromosome segregation ATPase
MTPTSSSIAQLVPLVEKLRALLSQHPEDRAWPEFATAPEAGQTLGQPLGQVLAEMWPALGVPSQPLGHDFLGHLERVRLKASQNLALELERRGQVLDSAQALVEGQARAAQDGQVSAQEALNQAQAATVPLEQAWQEAQERVEALTVQCRNLGQWLHGVEPFGLNGFRDAKGRSFGGEVVQDYTDRLQRLTQSLREARALADQRQDTLQAARQRVSQAQEACRLADQGTQSLRLGLSRRAPQMARGRAEQAQLEQELAQARQDLERSRELSRLHQEALTLAAGLLRPALLPAALASDPLAAAAREIASAAQAGRAAQRLARLIQEQERRLALLGGQAQEVQAQTREINRELKRLEDGLPALLAPLTSRDTATPPSRAGATAKLSTLLARLEDLAPSAHRAHHRLTRTRQRLDLGLKRCKAWLESWRLAGKAERAHLQQALALLEEARQSAQVQELMARELRAQVEPLARALGGINFLDLLPSLAAVAQGVAGHREQARHLERQAGELEQQIGPPSVASLSRPPAVLKDHSALARRLSGQKVDLERLTTMLRAAQGWRTLLASPLLAQARLQAQQVVKNLCGSLSLAAAQEQRLLADRHRVAAQLVKLRQDLGRERQERADREATLARSQELASNQAALIAQLEAQLQQSLAELASERQEARQQVQELKTGLEVQTQAQAQLRRQLETSQEQAASRAALLEQRQAQLRRLERQRQEQVQGLEQQRQEQVQRLEQMLKDQVGQLERQLASQEALADQQIAAMGRDLGRERQDGREARRRLEDTRQRLARRESAALALARQLRQAHHRLAALRLQAQTDRQDAEAARNYLSRTQARNQRLKTQLQNLENQLSLARQGQTAAGDLMSQLEAAGVDLNQLRQRLGQSQRLSAALKDKALERHRLLQQARVALAPLPYWQNQAQSLDQESARLRQELHQARQELSRAKGQVMAVSAERDEARARLASEQAARARQALDLLQGQTMAVELTATQTEAGRWATLAGDLAQALALNGRAHEEEVGRLRSQVGELSAQAQHLKDQLDRLSLMVAMYNRAGGAPGPARVRVSSLTPAQMDRVLDRLSAVRHRLKQLGRSTIGHWALIAALTAGLVTVAPNTPSKATNRVSPVLPPRQEVQQLKQGLAYGPTFDIPAQASLHLKAPAQAELELNLVPLRKQSQDLPAGVREEVAALARRSGLSPQVLLTSARAAFADREVVEPQALHELADAARSLAQRHPTIFAELSQKGLPKQVQDLAKLQDAPDKAQHLFMDRLYREYRSLGFSPEEALGALAANERAIKGLKGNWRSPGIFLGQVQPLASLETLTLTEFMARITPYMESRLEYYLKGGGVTFTGDLSLYAKNLAFDIYCAAKKFDVPVSLMLMIAHQETTFANVLGDSNRSASPFQIFEPTRKLIINSMERNRFVGPPQGLHLERHLTMATYMAAFHVRELMQESYQPASGGHPAHVDTDKVLKRYNGSMAYIGAVAARQRQLTSFLHGGRS